MPEVPHDATVALRLELGRMTDKANALEAALRKEVMAVIADAASENARLKAEVKRLRKAGRPLYDWYLETTDCDCDKCNTIKGEWIAAEGGQS